ncbi:MAG: IS630 transposase-related protein [Pseudomonadota bacterium]
MLYSVSFRSRVLAVEVREGLINQETADHFGIGIASVARWRFRIKPKAYLQRKPYKIDMAALADDVRQFPDAYKNQCAQRFGVMVQAICHGFKRLGVA